LDDSGALTVSQASYDHTRTYWDKIGVTVVVVTHRPRPDDWDPEAPFHFVDGVEAALATARQLAGDRVVEVARQALLRVGPRTAPVGGP
jgi:dihydrofolate reductase